MFEKLWTEYDPDATLTIHLSRLQSFLEDLAPPLGFKDKDMPEKEILRTISKTQEERTAGGGGKEEQEN